MTQPTPEDVYQDIWKQHVENEDGQLDIEAVKTLLFDYGAVLHNNSILYHYITNGQITDPQTDINKVMLVSDQFIADTLDGELQSVLGTLLNEVQWAEDEDLDTDATLTHLINFVENLYNQSNEAP